MTTRFVATKSTYLPVVFRLYRLHSYGANKGQPDPGSFVTLVLDRCVEPKFPGEKYETVKMTIDKLKEILRESNIRWQILACQESEAERIERRKANEIEVLEEQKPVAVPIIENAHPASSNVPMGVDDEALGVREDDGRIRTTKSKKTNKKAAQAVAA